MIWPQILGGSVVAAVLLFFVSTRYRRSGVAAFASVVFLAAATTLVVGLQVRPPSSWMRGFVLPMGLTSLVLAAEALFIARLLAGRGLVFWLFLPSFLVLWGLAGLITFAVLAAAYPGS